MDCLDSGVHVCKLASLIHQRGLQAHREDPTLSGVSKSIHQRGLQAHREDPTLPGVSKPIHQRELQAHKEEPSLTELTKSIKEGANFKYFTENIKHFFGNIVPWVSRNVVATSRKCSLSMSGPYSLLFLLVSE